MTSCARGPYYRDMNNGEYSIAARNMQTLAYEALRIAQLNEHRGEMSSSAILCAKEAEARFNEERFALCLGWALESLAYSVGKFNPDWRAVEDALDRADEDEYSRA